MIIEMCIKAYKPCVHYIVLGEKNAPNPNPNPDPNI